MTKTIDLTGEQADWIRRELGKRVYYAAEEIQKCADDFRDAQRAQDNSYLDWFRRLLDIDGLNMQRRWFDRIGWEFGQPVNSIEVTPEFLELLFESYRTAVHDFTDGRDALTPGPEEVVETHHGFKATAALGDVLMAAGWTPPSREKVA